MLTFTVNVLAYYSTVIFKQAGFDEKSALLSSLGCGILNFLGALPAFFTIDRFGRRRLLLWTLPILSVLLFITASSFGMTKEEQRNGLLLTTLYLFMFAYSPGMGPVPFTYSAEVFSLSARPLGMSSATSITWMFNFVISFTFPKMMNDMGSGGAFCFYGGCNLAGFLYVLFLLPETKEKSLEALDAVFAGTNKDFAGQNFSDMKRRWSKYVLRQDVKPTVDEDVRELDPIEPVAEVTVPATPNSQADEEAKVEDTRARRSMVRNHETQESLDRTES